MQGMMVVVELYLIRILTNFDITELLRDRRTDERTDEWKSGHLCRKVRKTGRYFIQGLMVV